MSPRLTTLLGTSLLLAAGAVALVWHLNRRGEAPLDANAPTLVAWKPTAEQIAQGAYLARAGNCAGCHTAQGGAAYAGGRGIATPFGTVYASNLTPDADTGLGRWTADHFWRALHHGRAKDGRLLYPAFPYPNTTQIGRDDADALFAFLGSLPPVAQASPPHALRFPYNTQAALAVWRALYFSAGASPPDPQRSAAWNRGAYLVKGLGHCSACHSTRNAWGASDNALSLAGGLIPSQNWYAPSLTDVGEASLAHWPMDEAVKLLKTGQTDRAVVTGPMAEVVRHSTQHLSDADLRAMVGYLQTLHPSAPAKAPAKAVAAGPLAALGAQVYERHCVACHGERGQGVPGAYPPLAGNRAVTMAQTTNLVQTVLQGGFAPATTGNPRPFGMPPYVLVLSDREVAAVLTHVRSQWGNDAGAVSELDVARHRDTARH